MSRTKIIVTKPFCSAIERNSKPNKLMNTKVTNALITPRTNLTTFASMGDKNIVTRGVVIASAGLEADSNKKTAKQNSRLIIPVGENKDRRVGLGTRSFVFMIKCVS